MPATEVQLHRTCPSHAPSFFEYSEQSARTLGTIHFSSLGYSSLPEKLDTYSNMKGGKKIVRREGRLSASCRAIARCQHRASRATIVNLRGEMPVCARALCAPIVSTPAPSPRSREGLACCNSSGGHAPVSDYLTIPRFHTSVSVLKYCAVVQSRSPPFVSSPAFVEKVSNDRNILNRKRPQQNRGQKQKQDKRSRGCFSGFRK